MDDLNGIDVQSISFRPGDSDTVVEITYAERRHQQTFGLAKFEVLLFEAHKAPAMVADLIASAEELVDEMLVQIQNPPAKIPGERRSVPS